MNTETITERLEHLQSTIHLSNGDVMRGLSGLQDFKYVKSVWFSQGKDLVVLGHVLIEYWNTDEIRNIFNNELALMFGQNKETGLLEIKGYTNANKPNFNEFFSEIVFADDASKHPLETLNELKKYFKGVL